MCSHATPFNMALWLCPEITNSVINRPTRARYEFLYSFLVVTLGCHISISSSTKNELKMSSGQLLPRVAVQVKINRVFMFLFYNITRQIRQNAIHRNPVQLLLPLLSNICFQVVFSYSIQPNVVDDCSGTKMP